MSNDTAFVSRVPIQRRITLIHLNPKDHSLILIAHGAQKRVTCSTRELLDEWGVNDLSEIVGMACDVREVERNGWKSHTLIGPWKHPEVDL